MKAGIADPVKVSITMQKHCKHVSAVTNNHENRGIFGGGVF
jgi:hypothetical protein